jgi:hypothetical protein
MDDQKTDREGSNIKEVLRFAFWVTVIMIASFLFTLFLVSKLFF